MAEQNLFHDRVAVRIADHVATVELARADKLNAIDPPMFDGLIEAGEWVKARADVRAIVLTGQGRMFCAGLDFMSFAAMAEQAGSDLPPLEARTHGLANKPQYAALVWREQAVPVIAALPGGALGGGLQLALGADIRLADAASKFAIAEIRWGLVPDMGWSVLLPQIMREDVMRELTYTGRELVGQDAVDAGLVTRISDDPKAEAQAIAADIARMSPSAMRGAKRLIDGLGGWMPAERLLEESVEQAKVIGKPHQVEAVMARMEKRAPKFG